MTKSIASLPDDTPVTELLSLGFNPDSGALLAVTLEFSGLSPEVQLQMIERYKSLLQIYQDRIEDGIGEAEILLDNLFRRH